MPSPLVRPFKGLLFNREKISDIGACICPPYDIITDPGQYYRKGPFNTVRLELPQPEEGLTPYESAARTLRRWLHEHYLVFDDRESIYIYDEEFEFGGRRYARRGIIPLVRLDEGGILTHEETRKKAKEDREKLITTLRTFTSLIFGLYDDKQGLVAKAIGQARREMLFDFNDESIRRTFWRITGEADIDRITTLFAPKSIYIADGHHRLAVSMKLGLRYTAMYLTNMWDPSVIILPYHRTVKLRQKKRLSDLLARVAGSLAVDSIPSAEVTTANDVMNLTSSPREPSFLLYAREDREHLYLLRQRKASLTDEATPPALRRLRVTIGHAGILRGLLGVADDEISFVKDVDEVLACVREGESDFALLVPPTTVEEVKDVAEHHLFMPPKSTYFYPKIPAGLVFYTYG